MEAATKPKSKATRKSEVAAGAVTEDDNQPQVEEPTEPEETKGSRASDIEPPDPADTVEDVIEVFEPREDVKRWVIGKPPQEGGENDEYSIYTQQPLGHVDRARFFGLVTRTLATAIKEGGGVELGFDDVLGPGGGNIRQRAQSLAARDIQDASSFMTMAFTLLSYTPDFLLECYCIWLGVPGEERIWAKHVMSQPRIPEQDQWGITDDDAFEMAERFIDQNYEEIRRFFVERVPRLFARVRSKEQTRRKASDSSKQSKS